MDLKEIQNTHDLAQLLIELANLLRKSPKFNIQDILKPEKELPFKKVPKISFKNMKVAELREECKKRGIKRYSKKKKKELIKILTEHDEGTDDIDKLRYALGGND